MEHPDVARAEAFGTPDAWPGNRAQRRLQLEGAAAAVQDALDTIVAVSIDTGIPCPDVQQSALSLIEQINAEYEEVAP